MEEMEKVKARLRADSEQLERERDCYHEAARKLREREIACVSKERELQAWEEDLLNRERVLESREAGVRAVLEAATPPSPPPPDLDPLRPGDLVQFRGKGPIGKVSRGWRTERGFVYSVTWPGGTRTGTYLRRELERA
jgi:hypothetical protein